MAEHLLRNQSLFLERKGLDEPQKKRGRKSRRLGVQLPSVALMVMKNYASVNRKWWNKMAKEGCGFTQPWLDLDPEIVEKIASGRIKKIPKPLNEIWPISILSDVKNKNVLCLASGGGQQSAVFGILGANVTVIDISDAQLEGDKKAAAHYGYPIKALKGNMEDLSVIKGNSFDIVYQAPSMTYVPDVRKVYSGVSGVLRKGGLYRADAYNPQSQFIDWNGKSYSINVSYSVKEKRRSRTENVIEFRHNMDEIFNGLIENGFAIERVEEMPERLYQSEKDMPGSWGHSLRFIRGIFAILARKQ